MPHMPSLCASSSEETFQQMRKIEYCVMSVSIPSAKKSVQCDESIGVIVVASLILNHLRIVLFLP